MDTEFEKEAKKNLEVARKEGNFHLQLIILQNIADDLVRNGQLEKAIMYLEDAEKIAEKAGKHRIRVLIMCYMSSLYLDLNNYFETMRLCSQAMEICQRHDYDMEKIDIMMQMAQAYGIKKDYASEAQLLNRALEIVRDSGHKRREKVILDILLDAYQQMKEDSAIVEPYQARLEEVCASLDCCDKSLKGLDKIPRYLEKGKIDRAFDELKKIMKKVTDEGDTQSMADVFTMFATAYADLKDFNNALKYMMDSYELHKKVWSLGAMSFCLAHIAKFYWNLGQKEEAKKTANSLIAFCDEFGVDPDETASEICNEILT